MNGESFEEINHQDAVSFLGSLRSRNQAKSDFLFIVLKPISHREIKLIWYLSLNFSYRGQIILELKSSEAVSEDDPSNLDYRWRSAKVSMSLKKRISPRFYKIFDPAVTKEGVDAVSVSLESSRRGSAASHPGRAVLARFAFSVLLSAWTSFFVFVFCPL